MDHREEAFKTKFVGAARQLGVAPDQVVSLKLRENVGGYREYQELFDALQRDAGLDTSPVAGSFQGNARLVGNARTKVIIVEHETGLEILYVAGSVASIIGLVPLVLQCWKVIRGHIRRRHHDEFLALESRRIDSSGRLAEEQGHGVGLPWSESLDIMNRGLLSAAENLDAELQRLRTTVGSLADRMSAVEKKLADTKLRRVAIAGKTKTKKRPST
jgi:hypothetical protein